MTKVIEFPKRENPELLKGARSVFEDDGLNVIRTTSIEEFYFTETVNPYSRLFDTLCKFLSVLSEPVKLS